MFLQNWCSQSVSSSLFGKKIAGNNRNCNEADAQSFSLSLHVDHADFLMTSFVYRVNEINTLLLLPFFTALLYLCILHLSPISFLCFSAWSCSSPAIHPLWNRNPVCIALLWREYMYFASQKLFVRNFFILVLYIYKKWVRTW